MLNIWFDEQFEIAYKVELKASVLSLRHDDIMHIHIKDVDELLRGDIKDIVKGLYQIGKGKKFANVITFEKYLIISRETRATAAKEITVKYTIEDAIVVKSIPLKLTINFISH